MSKPIIKTLLNLNETFYWMCFHANVGAQAHPFLEFNGLMHKYIECLAKSGVDPQQANVHGGEAFPVEDHDLEYLGEKLACIFAPMIAANPRAQEILSKHLFGEHRKKRFESLKEQAFAAQKDVLIKLSER